MGGFWELGLLSAVAGSMFGSLVWAGALFCQVDSE